MLQLAVGFSLVVVPERLDDEPLVHEDLDVRESQRSARAFRNVPASPALLLFVRGETATSERMALPTTIGEQMPSARDVILKHIDAFNARDSDADPWAVDAEMTAPGAKLSGRDNVIGFLAAFQEAFPDLRLEVEQLLTDGPAAAAEGTLTGTHDGVLHTPSGEVAPTGRAVELRWAAVYVTEGGTLKSEHLFFDQMDFLGQLGLLPG